MPEGTTNIAGIEIPSTDPIFLAVVGVHILLGLVCTITAPIAMLSQKRAGRHPRFGTCPHSRDVQSGPIAPANLLAVASHRRYSFNRSRSLVASAGAALKHTRPRPSFPHGKLGFFLGNGHGLRGIDSLLPANLMVRPEENLHGWRPQFSLSRQVEGVPLHLDDARMRPGLRDRLGRLCGRSVLAPHRWSFKISILSSR